MSKTGRCNYRRDLRGTRKAQRRISVHGVKCEPPDLRKLSRAVIAMAMRDAEADAEVKAARAGEMANESASDDQSVGGPGEEARP